MRITNLNECKELAEQMGEFAFRTMMLPPVFWWVSTAQYEVRKIDIQKKP